MITLIIVILGLLTLIIGAMSLYLTLLKRTVAKQSEEYDDHRHATMRYIDIKDCSVGDEMYRLEQRLCKLEHKLKVEK